jgi:hypothetical protein
MIGENDLKRPLMSRSLERRNSEDQKSPFAEEL